MAAVSVPHPHLWAPGDPYLYRASVTVSDAAGRKLEGYITESGIRSIKVMPDGQLDLNGRALEPARASASTSRISRPEPRSVLLSWRT